MKYKNDVSVIVPIYNAEVFITKFMNAYCSQTFLDKNIELILVDNGSTDKTKEIIFEYIDKFPNVRIDYKYFDEKADSYAARNHGVREANGKVLVFTDIDCIVDQQWLENIMNSVSLGCIISGKIEIDIQDKKNIWELFDSSAHLNSVENAKKGKVATANLAVLKSDFNKVGFFTERVSGGDYEWSQKAVTKGMKVEFKPEVKVLHPSRKTFSEIYTKSMRLAYGKGVEWKSKNKSLLILKLVYFLKLFNVRTNLMHSRFLYKNGIELKSIIDFNLQYTKIRVGQLKFAINGFNRVNIRTLNIK